MNKEKEQSGFTLIEILVVIGIIAILAVIVLIAINPGRQFAQSRNTQRTSNVNAILNAVGQRMADNKGVFLSQSGPCSTAVFDLPTTATRMSSSVYNIAPCLVPTYITALPFDPSTTTPIAKWTTDSDYDTGYHIIKESTGRIKVCAYTIEENVSTDPICITR